MNCKQGDLAFVKRGYHGYENAGKVCEVVSLLSPDVVLGHQWKVRFSTPMKLINGSKSEFARCPDAWLQPIRDPGDDAVDEVIQRLGTPHKETA